MSPMILGIFKALARPFIAKKIDEFISTNEYDKPQPHPAQKSTQLGMVGLGAIPATAISVAALTDIGSLEVTLASIAALLINAIFLYRSEKK